MRESMGAAWIFSICLTFIILFTAYLAISVNYAKAFRIKNEITTMIEENEGYNAALESDIENYLTSQGYSAKGKCADILNDFDSGARAREWTDVKCIQPDLRGNCGACVYRADASSANDDVEAPKVYYKVIAFFKFDLPIVNYITTFQVSGDTQPIYEFASDGGYY